MSRKPVRDHECAAPGCSTRISRQRLMCFAHWQMVPGDLQRDVYRTFRAMTRADCARLMLAARRPYLQAVDAAVAALSA